MPPPCCLLPGGSLSAVGVTLHTMTQKTCWAIASMPTEQICWEVAAVWCGGHILPVPFVLAMLP